MIEEIKNAKDNVSGTVKETAGRMTENEDLELKGKLQTMKSQIGNKMEGMKEEMAEKANNFIDKVKPNKKDNSNHS